MGSGSGYGSDGGHAINSSIVMVGGSAYGQTRRLDLPGSGGGSSLSGRGGSGGGLLNITVNKLLLIEGELECMTFNLKLVVNL